MATTKASRKAKRESHVKGHESDNASTIFKARKTHNSKEAITKGAVKKSDAKGRQTREYILKNKDKPMAQNGRQPGRQLIRWNVCTDQILLLVMDYELKRHGISVPWDAIAKRLASEKETTGACVQQHITKLRKEMLARGSWVPPLSGKPGTKQQLTDVRGYVTVTNKNGESETREVSWTENAFKYVDLVHINKANMFKAYGSSKDAEDIPGPVRRMVKANESARDLSDDEMDPAELPSAEEFAPSGKESKFTKRTTRASAKLGGNFKQNSCDTESDADGESEYEGSVNQDQPCKPVMMTLYQSDEESDGFSGMVYLQLSPDILARYPEGINEDYRKTHVILMGETNEDGEEVFNEKCSGHGGSYSGPHHPSNTAENYAQAFEHGLGYSMMAANTAANYEAAFGGGEEYSIMDANTYENYADAFGGGDEDISELGRDDTDDSDDLDSEDSGSDHRDQRVAGPIADHNFQMLQSSNQATGFGGNSQTSDMFNQVNNQQSGYGNLMGMSNLASALTNSASLQNEPDPAPYNMWENPADPFILYSDVGYQDHLVDGTVNTAADEEDYDGKKFAQIVTERRARNGNGNGSGYGTNTANSAHQPFASDTSQIVGIPTGMGEQHHQEANDFPMDGPGINNGNVGTDMQEFVGNQSQFPNYPSFFDEDYLNFPSEFGYAEY